MSGLLFQIERKQKETIAHRDKLKSKRQKVPAKMVKPQKIQAKLPPSAPVPGSLLVAKLRVAQRRAKKRYMEDKVKIIGVQAPTTIHERMEEFLSKHKGDPTMPQSKKALGLACILKFLDDDAKQIPTVMTEGPQPSEPPTRTEHSWKKE